jgi:endonuclease YncB( thermonuclease family)
VSYDSEVKRLLLTQRAYPCSIKRVIDGDTIEVVVDHGFELTSMQTIRVFGVNCPENNTAAGREVTEFVGRWLSLSLDGFTLYSYSKRDKYGRRLADIQRNLDGKLLTNFLLVNNYAVEYLP